MSQTANLAIEHIATNQYQKEVTANTAFDALDGALAGKLEVGLADADVVLSAAEALEHMVLRATGTLTQTCAIVVPTNTKLYAVLHDADGGVNVAIRTAAGSGVTLAPGERAVVYCDGTNVVEVLRAAPTGVAAAPFDVGCSFNGMPGASAVLLRLPMVRAVTFPADMAGSRGIAGTAATASATFDLRRNGAAFATMTFAAGASTATFAAASETAFVAGDLLSITSPATPDTTLSDLGLVLAGERA
nr:conserved uncharacterized protein [uncultured bacterium]